MGGGLECPSSILLCAEDDSSIWCFDEDGMERGGSMGSQMVVGFEGNQERSDLFGGSLMGFPLQTDECMGVLASREAEHLPKSDYAGKLQSAPLVLSSRREAVEWIEKVHAYYTFGPTTACLSVNYLDRFLSCYDLPQGKEWMTQLLAVACLSLAAKMEESLVPLSLDLQVCEPRYIFEAKTIQRMELLVLSTLEWRMRPVTPFSFVDYFLCKFSDAKTLPVSSLMSQSFEVIKNVTKRIDFLEFLPSQIALAVSIFVTSINHATDHGKLLSSFFFVDKGRAMRCYDMIKDLAFLTNTFKCPSVSSFCIFQGPNVLVDGKRNYSDITTAGTQLNSSYISPEVKRRRLYGNPTS